MPICEFRHNLVHSWHEATCIYSDAVSRMKASINGNNGHHEEFSQAMNRAAKARLKAEIARLAVEIHRAEHGC